MIWGMKDPAFQQNELDVWVKNWDNVRVVKLDDVGHFPQEEAPDDIIRELKTEKI